jgi:hypothetical protein
LTADRIDQHVVQSGFIKLLVPMDVRQEALASTDWAEAGLKHYRNLAKLIGESPSAAV